MKKVLAFLLAVLMLASIGCAWAEETAEEPAEITFQGIPWGSSADDVRELMDKLGVPGWSVNHTKGNGSAGFGREYVLAENGTNIEWNKTSTDSQTYVARQIGYSMPGMTVAGYEADTIYFNFAINGEVAELVSVTFTSVKNYDSETAWNDLVNKLTQVYGAGELLEGASGTEYVTVGGNNTAVTLYYKYGDTVALTYGRTDAIAILDTYFMQIESPEAVDSTDTSGL